MLKPAFSSVEHPHPPVDEGGHQLALWPRVGHEDVDFFYGADAGESTPAQFGGVSHDDHRGSTTCHQPADLRFALIVGAGALLAAESVDTEDCKVDGQLLEQGVSP